MAYLEKRRRLWYAAHTIPPNARHLFDGRRRFVKSLGTESQAEAKRRMVPLEADWRRQIAVATSSTPNQLEQEYRHWFNAIRDARSDNERLLTESLLRDELEARLKQAALTAGINSDDEEALQALPEYADAVDRYQYATGQKVRLDVHLEGYLAVAGLRPKTVAQWRAAVHALAKAFPFTDQVTGPAVQAHINDRLQGGASVGTIRKQLSGWRGYWRHLAGLGIVARRPTPFDDLDLPRKRRGGGPRRTAFTEVEAVELLRSAMNKRRKDQPLVDLIRIGMWTGARRAEICALRVEDVGDWFLHIRESKTDAGVRHLPIHPKLAPTIRRLVSDSLDGYLIPGLQANSLEDRGDAIGKRFSNLKRRHGFGPQHVLHSLRRTISTMLQNSGLDEPTAAEIVGHASARGMTYGHYSEGLSSDKRYIALAKIDYPDYPEEPI